MKLLLPFLSLLCVSGLSAREASWQGIWKLASTPDMGGTIEQCTAEMSFIKRHIARARLKKLNPAYQRILLTRSGTEITFQFEERQPLRVASDGKPMAWTREDGEKFMVSVKSSPDGLLQHYQGEDGERTNQFRVDTAGKALTLNVTVKSQKLPKPLVYSLSYVR